MSGPVTYRLDDSVAFITMDDGKVNALGPSMQQALNEALDKLAREDPRKAELVKLRYFAGLSVQEAAEVLGISRATADRYWAYAKAWLYCAISGEDRPTPG